MISIYFISKILFVIYLNAKTPLFFKRILIAMPAKARASNNNTTIKSNMTEFWIKITKISDTVLVFHG